MNTDTGFYQELTDPDELLREGDEYKHPTGEWYPIRSSVGSKRSTIDMGCGVRRPITPTPSVTEPEYRMLEVGEVLQTGDEYQRSRDGQWHPTADAGARIEAGEDLTYRRRVARILPAPECFTGLFSQVERTTGTHPSLFAPYGQPHPNDPKGIAAISKCPLHLLPVAIMEETAWVLKGGAEKYGIRNYRHNKVCASTYISAIMRHLNKWREREDLDTESGRSHLAHIAANCAILMDAAQHGTLEDDRA